MTLLFWSLFALVLLGSIASGIRARRIALTAVGCDPTWLPRQWRYLRNEVERGRNRRRM